MRAPVDAGTVGMGWLTDGLLPLEDWGESLRALLAQSIQSFAEASWEFLKGSFTASSFLPGSDATDWWIAVMGGNVDVYVDGVYQHTMEYPGMLNVLVVAMLPLLVIFVTFQVVMSVFRASTAGMVRAFATALLAVPATYMMAGLVFMGLRATDAMTIWILEIGTDGTDGDEVGINAIFTLIGMQYDPDADGGEGGVLVDANFEIWQLAAMHEEPGRILLPWVVAFVILVVCFILMLMMIFRTVAVLVLTMFTPIPVFSLSFEAAKSIFPKWASFVVALLLAKPIAASIVKFGITMASIGSDWVQIVAGVVLIIVAAAMPLLMLAFVSFMTPESSRALEGAAVGSAMAGQRRVSSTMRGGARTAGRGATTAARSASRTASRTARSASRAVRQ